MNHRIARVLQPLLRFLRRPGRPPVMTPPAPVLGIGVGSYGIPTVVVRGVR